MNAVKTLYELTGQESGIVVYFGGGVPEALVCAWGDVAGLPRLSPLGFGVLGLGESIPVVKPEDCENVPGYLDGARIIFAHGEEPLPERARVYDLPELRAAVLAPKGWA